MQDSPPADILEGWNSELEIAGLSHVMKVFFVNSTYRDEVCSWVTAVPRHLGMDFFQGPRQAADYECRSTTSFEYRHENGAVLLRVGLHGCADPYATKEEVKLSCCIAMECIRTVYSNTKCSNPEKKSLLMKAREWRELHPSTKDVWLAAFDSINFDRRIFRTLSDAWCAETSDNTERDEFDDIHVRDCIASKILPRVLNLALTCAYHLVNGISVALEVVSDTPLLYIICPLVKLMLSNRETILQSFLQLDFLCFSVNLQNICADSIYDLQSLNDIFAFMVAFILKEGGATLSLDNIRKKNDTELDLDDRIQKFCESRKAILKSRNCEGYQYSIDTRKIIIITDQLFDNLMKHAYKTEVHSRAVFV